MKKYLPRVRLYPEQDLDQKIIKWLCSLPDRTKSNAIKEALLRGIPNAPSTIQVNSTLDIDALRRNFLPDIRRVIDAALQDVKVASFAPKEDDSEEDEEEIEGILDELELSFMLDEEEDTW